MLELVNAAIPPLKRNNDMMVWGCECIPILEEETKLHSVNVVLATMSIAKDYYTDLQVLRQASDVFDIKIKPGLMENICRILAVLETPPEQFPTINMYDVMRKYSSNHRRSLSTSAADTSKYHQILKSIAACFRSVLSVFYIDNDDYFNLLVYGFELTSLLIQDDDKNLEDDPRWSELDSIIDEVYKYQFTTLDPNYMREELENFLESLNENNGVDPD